VNEFLSNLWQTILQEKLRHGVNGTAAGTGLGMPSSDPIIDMLKAATLLIGIVASLYLIHKTRKEISNVSLVRERELLEIKLLTKQLSDKD
jgi:hypothetical protein